MSNSIHRRSILDAPDRHWDKLDKLILVAGHAVYVGDDRRAAADDRSWVLQNFQKGEPTCYIEHIRRGVELAALQPNSLLVFTGGQTRLEAGPNSEAKSYCLLADQFDWWKMTDVIDRTAIEEYARDSYENLLFGIARFRECTSVYPASIEIVSWAFKRERFDFHRETIIWPGDDQHYKYHAVNNPNYLAQTLEGEAKTFGAFKQDPFGTEDHLRSKRARRNPFYQMPPYPATCPEIAGLINHKTSDGRIYNGTLPWHYETREDDRIL